MALTSNNKIKFFKLLFTVLFLFGVFFYFNSLLNWQVLLFLILIPCLFWGFKSKVWIFLVAAPPSLLLGKILNFSVGGDFIYEARVAEVLLFLALVIFGLDAYINGWIKKIKMDSIVLVLFLYLIASLLSFCYIADLKFFIFGLKIIGFSFVAYVLALNLLNNEFRIRWFLRSIMLTVLVLSIQIFVKFYQMGWSTKFFFQRNLIELPLGPIALVSGVLAFLLPLILTLYFRKSKDQQERWVILVIFFLGGVAIFLGLGKAAIFSLGLALFYLFLKLRRKRVVFLLFGTGFLAVVLIFFPSFLSGLIERISRIFVSENTKFRITEYRLGWEIIRNHFWIGVGLGQQLFYYKVKMNWQNSQMVNNFLLQAFIDLGVIGLGLALVGIVVIFKKIKVKIKTIKSKRSKVLIYGLAGSFLVAFINGLVEVTIFAFPYAIIFWLLLGVFNNIEEYA